MATYREPVGYREGQRQWMLDNKLLELAQLNLNLLELSYWGYTDYVLTNGKLVLMPGIEFSVEKDGKDYDFKAVLWARDNPYVQLFERVAHDDVLSNYMHLIYPDLVLRCIYGRSGEYHSEFDCIVSNLAADHVTIRPTGTYAKALSKLYFSEKVLNINPDTRISVWNDNSKFTISFEEDLYLSINL